MWDLLIYRGTAFREAFRAIGGLRALMQAPFMALTATAPPAVQSEIISSLFLHDPVLVTCDANRKNIFFLQVPLGA